MRFVTDEHIARAAADILRSRGHEVHASRFVLKIGATDHDIAIWANTNHAIIVTRDKWFREAIARRPGRATRFPGAGRVLLTCHDLEIVDRLQSHVERIEREDALRARDVDPRLIVEITSIRFILEL